MVSLLKFHHRRPKGPKQESRGGSSSYFVEQRGEEKCWKCGGLITRGIILIHLGLPPTIPTLVNLMFITRFMVMTSTIALHYILNFDKLSPMQVMRGNPKNLARSKKGKPKVDQPPNQLLTNPTPWNHDLHIWRH